LRDAFSNVTPVFSSPLSGEHSASAADQPNAKYQLRGIAGTNVRLQYAAGHSAAPQQLRSKMLEHDPEKWKPVFPRGKRQAFARRFAQTIR